MILTFKDFIFEMATNKRKFLEHIRDASSLSSRDSGILHLVKILIFISPDPSWYKSLSNTINHLSKQRVKSKVSYKEIYNALVCPTFCNSNDELDDSIFKDVYEVYINEYEEMTPRPYDSKMKEEILKGFDMIANIIHSHRLTNKNHIRDEILKIKGN